MALHSWSFREKIYAISSNTRVRFVATRYISALLVAGESLLFARILGPESFGTFALIIQIAGLLLFTAAGSASGYVHAYYKNSDHLLDKYYVICSFAQYLVGTIIATFIFLAFRPHLTPAVILFAIYIPYFVTEPMLRVKNHFTLSAFGKGLGSLSTLLLTGFLFVISPLASHQFQLKDAILVMLTGSFVGYSAYYGILLFKEYLDIYSFGDVRLLWKRQSWTNYWVKILLPGLPLSLASMVFQIFTFTDRLFIEYYQPTSSLSIYALSWQLSQGAFLVLSSMNLISSVRIGEQISQAPSRLTNTIYHQLKTTALAGLLTYITLIAGVFLLHSTVYHDYYQLVLITFLLSAGYLSHNIIGSVTSILFYERRQTQLIAGYICLIIISLIGNITTYMNGWWYGIPIIISSISLIILDLWLLWYTMKLVSNLERA